MSIYERMLDKYVESVQYNQNDIPKKLPGQPHIDIIEYIKTVLVPSLEITLRRRDVSYVTGNLDKITNIESAICNLVLLHSNMKPKI